MNKTASGVLTGSLAAAVLLFFLFLLNAGIWISLAAGALSYVAFTLLFTTREKRLEFVAEGVTKDEVALIITQGRQKVAEIVKTNGTIGNPKVHGQVQEVCKLAGSIFDDLERSPKGVKNARKFLTYYLDTTAYIVSRYAELSTGVHFSEDAREALSKVEESLELIKETFVSQIGRLMQDDVSDLEIEMELLKKTIKTEGL